MTKLFMMVGIAGSGKSTLAKKIAEQENAVIFSSDALREELYGDIAAQGDNNALFEELHKRLRKALSEGKNVVHDATNISSKERRAFLSTLKKYDVYKTAIIVATPFEKCLEQNAARERHVPEFVMRRQYKNFTVPCMQEGFDKVEIHYPDDFTPISLSKILMDSRATSHDNHYHTYSIGTHMDEALMYLFKNYSVFIVNKGAFIGENLMIATVFHDIGKPFCKEFKNGKGEPTEEAHYFGHMQVGAYLALLSEEIKEESKIDVALLIQYHMEPYLSWKQSEKAKKKDIEFLGEDFVELVEIIHDCDVNAH